MLFEIRHWVEYYKLWNCVCIIEFVLTKYQKMRRQEGNEWIMTMCILQFIYFTAKILYDVCRLMCRR